MFRRASIGNISMAAATRVPVSGWVRPATTAMRAATTSSSFVPKTQMQKHPPGGPVTRSPTGKPARLSKKEAAALAAQGGKLEGDQYVFEVEDDAKGSRRKQKVSTIKGILFRMTALGLLGYSTSAAWSQNYKVPKIDAEYSFDALMTPEKNPNNDLAVLQSRSEESKLKQAMTSLQDSFGGHHFQRDDDVTYEGTYTWADVAPTLQPGDLVLMRGTGPLSQKIILGSHFYNWISDRSLRYSHVGMVMDVIPPQQNNQEKKKNTASKSSSGFWGGGGKAKSVPEETVAEQKRSSGSRASDYKVVLFEAVDNYDARISDWKGIQRFKAVQVVDTEKRIFGKDLGRWCYNRVAVRRMHGMEWTPERKAQLKKFVLEHEGKDLDQDQKMAIAYVSPTLYDIASPALERRNKTTCTQLIAKYFNSELNILPDESQNGGWPDVCYAPYWFAGGRALNMLSTFKAFQPAGRPTVGSGLDEALFLERQRKLRENPSEKDSLPNVFYGPEIRIAHPGATCYQDPCDPDTKNLEALKAEVMSEKQK